MYAFFENAQTLLAKRASTGLKETLYPEMAGTLHGLLAERAQCIAQHIAFRQYDTAKKQWCDYTWAETFAEIQRWRAAIHAEGVTAGDRVALMLRNCREWVLFEQAALGLGLITVPLYMLDRADNAVYVINDCDAKLLFIEGDTQWQALSERQTELAGLTRIISLNPVNRGHHPKLCHLTDWLAKTPVTAAPMIKVEVVSEAPATIIYTSRTLGRPKGVTLSHRNILENAWQAAKCLGVRQNDLFLSFLSPSHALERTVGYYLPMVAGATIAYVRSVQSLNSDLNALNPTAIVAVPRIYERFYMRIQSNVKERSKLFQRLFAKTVSLGWQVFEYQQKRGKWQIAFLLWPFFKYFIARPLLTKHLGGHLRIAISGGARLNPEVARFLVSLGVPVLQGYGLTETSPIISVNTLQDNLPASVGRPLPNLEVRIGDQDELQVRGPSIMLGYWNNTAATAQILDAEGWLYTGDQVHFQDGHIVITGRLKEIIALTNGEKVPPADMEIAIGTDPLFEQVIVIGESKPYLSALVVLNATAWATLAQAQGLPEDPKFAVDNAQVEKLLLRRVSELLHDFPGYAQVRRLAVLNDSWNLEEDLLSKTLKLRRKLVLERFKHVIELLYKGHSLQI